jgi:hypothetical protein
MVPLPSWTPRFLTCQPSSCVQKWQTSAVPWRQLHRTVCSRQCSTWRTPAELAVGCKFCCANSVAKTLLRKLVASLRRTNLKLCVSQNLVVLLIKLNYFRIRIPLGWDIWISEETTGEYTLVMK